MASYSSGYSSAEGEVEDINQCNTRVLPKSANTYELEKFKKKLLLIFNHKTFNNPNILARNGTEKDVEALTNTFKKVGFDVVVYNDLTEKEIFDTLDAFKEKNFTNYGCVAIAVLTHGSKGKLRAKDRRYNEVQVWNYLKVHDNPTLVTKPRILISQACRGSGNIEGVHVEPENNVAPDDDDEKESYYLPAEADILLIHSSYWDTPAFRDESEGSWFIQSLCKNVDELAATHHLESILTKVKREVAFEKEHTKFDIDTVSLQTKKQMPTVTTTLTRSLYLKKYGEFAPSTTDIPFQLLIRSFFSNMDHTNHTMEYLRLRQWISATEAYLKSEVPSEEGILRINTELQEYGRIVDCIGPQICQVLLQEVTMDVEGLQARFRDIADHVHMQTIKKLQESLNKAKDELARMNPLCSDISAVKRHLDQLASFKRDKVQPVSDKIETFIRQSQERAERVTQSTQERVAATGQGLIKIKATLLTRIAERQQVLENTLSRLQQQQQMLRNLQSRIRNASSMLVGLTSDQSISEMLKLELAKLDVLMEDILGMEDIVGNGSGTSEAGDVSEDLGTLKRLWSELQNRVKLRLKYELERRTAQPTHPENPDSLFKKVIKGIKNALITVWRFFTGFNRKVKKLLQWISDLETRLQLQLNQPLPQSIEQLQRLITNHKELMVSMQTRQKEVNKLCERDDPLWVKSRNLWRLARDRKRRLLVHLYDLKVLNGDTNFSWDEWRKQFLKFIDNNNFDLTDLFPEVDEDFSVVVLKQMFIDSINNSGFETSREDLNYVVKLFDENNVILLEEFVSALIPDWANQFSDTNTATAHNNTVPSPPEGRARSSAIRIPRNVVTQLRNVAILTG